MIWFLIACLSVVTIVPIFRPLALKAGFVDTPGGRKQHQEPVPPIGGLIIFAVIGIIQIIRGDVAENWSLYVGLAALLVIGAWDDRAQLSAWIKFAVQIAVSVLVVLYGECRLDNLGNMLGFGGLELGFMSIPFSVAAVVLLINAINLMDGLDGLAGGQSFIILGTLAIISGLNPDLLPILGALAGFLFYNMRSPWRARASIFLGDAGTLALGLMLAWYSISLANDPSINLEPISVAWILAIPIMDECAQFYRRVREGRHPFSPDRGHLHHHFRDAGFSPGHATMAILAISIILGVNGYALAVFGVPLVVLTLAWIVTILTHMHLIYRGNFYRLRLKRLLNSMK